MTRAFTCAIAIPARNEAALLPRCLSALASQTIASQHYATIVIANNCTDDTVDSAGSVAELDNLHIREISLSPECAHAGSARAAAMAAAAELSDIILTTDADCVPDCDWVEAMLAAFARNVDAVAGAVSGDWNELQHQPKAALATGKLEWEYLALLAQAEAVFDPVPHDPAPRHAQRCGANIGITKAMLKQVGGVPQIPSGEDRALLNAVERHGGKVRHDPRPHVTASARTVGRASGGMADALALRNSDDYVCDAQFEPADQLVQRLRHQRLARNRDGQLSNCDFDALKGQKKQRLRPAQLPAEIDRLRAMIAAAS